ncbi:hypothetical protein [Archangium sp.]|uniref:hypothetical protein n=1 Tax=Archangium sp. TaxID=1872627 RepID=UPI002D758F4C|nr:hypothetical protein [Archangium sp.]HYO58472.1 hypothetical protein [Archangium sp.]
MRLKTAKTSIRLSAEGETTMAALTEALGRPVRYRPPGSVFSKKRAGVTSLVEVYK